MYFSAVIWPVKFRLVHVQGTAVRAVAGCGDRSGTCWLLSCLQSAGYGPGLAAAHFRRAAGHGSAPTAVAVTPVRWGQPGHPRPRAVSGAGLGCKRNHTAAGGQARRPPGSSGCTEPPAVARPRWDRCAGPGASLRPGSGAHRRRQPQGAARPRRRSRPITRTPCGNASGQRSVVTAVLAVILEGASAARARPVRPQMQIIAGGIFWGAKPSQ